MDLGIERGARQTRLWEAAGRALRAAVGGTEMRCETGTPPRVIGSGYLLAVTAPLKAKKCAGAAKSLGAAPGNMRRNETIRQEIIGHRLRGDLRVHGAVSRGLRCGVAVRWAWFGRSRFVGRDDGALPLLDEPAGEHGGGIFLDPGINEAGDLFAEIGGVAEAGEFVTLQGVAGSGQKKFPGRLGAIGGHRILRCEALWKNRGDRSTREKLITSNHRVNELWKAVEEKEIFQKACSGCAGDYEDPERTAWEADPEEEEANAEFPVPEETAESKAGEGPHAE